MSTSKKDSPPSSWQSVAPTKVPRVIAGALGTKNRNRKVDTLARNNETIGSQDYTLLTELVAPLATIFSPNEHPPQIAGENLESWLERKLKELLERHQIIMRNAPAKELQPDQVRSIIIRSFYVPRATAMLRELHDRIGGPNLSDLLDPNKSAVDVTLKWADQRAGFDIVKASVSGKKKAGDPDERKTIKSWRKGDTIPEIQSIKNFLDKIEKAGKLDNESLFALRAWLIVARALAYCKKKAEDPIQDLMRESLNKAAPSTDEIISHLQHLDGEEKSRKLNAALQIIRFAIGRHYRSIAILARTIRLFLQKSRPPQVKIQNLHQREQTQRIQQENEAAVAIVSADAKTQRASIRRPRRRVAQFSLLHYAHAASNDDNFEPNSNSMIPVAA